MRPIHVWRFHDAPEELQALSTHGGDEDWVALVPAEHTAKYGDWRAPEWIESYGFGPCDTSEAVLENGDRVFIGAHA